MTTNIVTAKFCNSRRTTTRPLTQYDYGQILRIEGIDLPDAYEVDFSNNQYTGDSKPQLGDASGVAIPEEYIKTGKDIYAFIYLHAGESDGETFYWIKIPNELRPARTEETPTPEEQSIIDQTIAALNTGVQKVEDIADGLEEQIDTALQEAKDSGEFDGEDGFSPEITVEDITGGHRVTVVDKDGTEIFDVMDGEDGDTGRGIVTIEKTSTSGLVDTYTITYSDDTTGTFYVTNGENGDPGTPGFSPVVAISSITGGHRVTITSAIGTDSFDVLDGEDGNGIASVELNDDYTLTLTFDDGTSYTTTSIRGEPGEDGYSPVASVSKVGKVATITITDKTHTTTATVSDGEDGDPGISPTVTVTDITGGHRVTITDADGAHSFDVMDGDATDAPVQSVNGQTGAVVLNAQDVGAGTYSKPSGGIPASDLAAGVIPTVPVQDVQINGTSALSNGIANVPMASSSVPGVVMVNPNTGSNISIDSSGVIGVQPANGANIKDGSGFNGVITPARQHISAFYGFAKAAGDSTQSASSNPVGTYTEDAKAAIRQMLGVPSNDDIPEVPVRSVNGQTGAVVLDAADVGAYEKPASGIPASDLAAGVIPTVPVQDVQVAGTSVLSNGVANVPVATGQSVGVVRVGAGLAYLADTGQIYQDRATVADTKAGSSATGSAAYRPITPVRQNSSVFYGLAAAAGDTTQSASSNAIGAYTNAAKSAIQTMLGLSAIIGKVEGATASKSYAVGDAFLHSGALYKATAAIASGAAIVPSTNCTQTTIIDLIKGV